MHTNKTPEYSQVYPTNKIWGAELSSFLLVNMLEGSLGISLSPSKYELSYIEHVYHTLVSHYAMYVTCSASFIPPIILKVRVHDHLCLAYEKTEVQGE